MERNYIGVKMDYKTGKWRFLYKKPKNKKPTRDKALFETAIEAAFARDSKIHNDPIIKNAVASHIKFPCFS